ncbi:MAG: phenylalanine--tRNA ligase beta subunit-related protein [Acidobacteriota bacterium]
MDESPGAVRIDMKAGGTALGWATCLGACVKASPASLLDEIRRAVDQVAASAASPEREAVRKEVRDMLRFGRYKPTGRGKPASEYLVREAVQDTFPVINALADINNLVSLETGLPISIIDLDRAGALEFRLRRGKPGESYVFNPSGQVIDLADLQLLSAGPDDRPVATPDKDCQATKTDGGTCNALAVIYAPTARAGEAASAAARMADLFTSCCGGAVSHGCLT